MRHLFSYSSSNYLQKRVEWRGRSICGKWNSKEKKDIKYAPPWSSPIQCSNFFIGASFSNSSFLYSKALKPSVETILHHCGSLNTSVVFTRNWKSEFWGRRSEDEGSRNLKFCGKGASFLKDSQSIKFIVLPLLLVLLCSPLSAIWQ